MAIYDPPQPFWKRNLAGALDFLLAALGFGILVSKLFPGPVHARMVLPNGGITHEAFSLGTWQILLLAGLIVAYFVVLGCTGGTVFQRVFGMRRAKGPTAALYDPPQPLWKRNVAAILDFLLAAIVFGFALFMWFGASPHAPVVQANGTTTREIGGLGLWPSLALVALIIAYFVVSGRTGGTVFQRLFGMKRAKQA